MRNFEAQEKLKRKWRAGKKLAENSRKILELVKNLGKILEMELEKDFKKNLKKICELRKK